MNLPPIVSPQEWDAAREELLVKEKELTRARDALAAERRRMPRMAVEKDYALRGPGRPGEPARPVRGAPPADRLPLLLRARRGRLARARLPRLLVHGRPGRAPRAPQRPRHDARLVSRAPQADIERLKARMGWDDPRGTRSPTTSTPTSASTSGTAPTPSSATATRSSAPTSSTAAATRRWAAPGAYLDITALGRQEEWEDSPEGYPQTQAYVWWNLHDEYDEATRLRARPVGRRGLAARGEQHVIDSKTTLRIERTFQAPAERCSTRGPARR